MPTTPADSCAWDQDSGSKDCLQRRDFTSSSSSVEEAVPDTLKKKTRSRLSLNLGVFDDSPIKSPNLNLIPKFLRTSFTKLRLRDKAKTPERSRDSTEPVSLPTFSNDSIYEDDSICDLDSSPGPATSIPPIHSPDTWSFVQESLDKGLPIIPFPMPTIVIAENHIASKKHQFKEPKTSKSLRAKRQHIDNTDFVHEKSDAITHVQEELNKKSLDKLLHEAKHQLEQETLLKRKVKYVDL